MTASLELVHEPTLEELAESITRGHALVVQHGENMLGYAITVGEDLLRAYPLVQLGEWEDWVAANTPVTKSQDKAFRRLARHRELVDGAQGINHGLRMLHGIGQEQNLRPGHEARRARDVEIRRLAKVGHSKTEIGELVGLSHETVRRVLDPEYRRRVEALKHEKQARDRDAKRALAEQTRQQSVKKALVKEGQAFNEVYAMLTRMDDLLGQARGETEDREKRRAIAEMHAMRNKMRDMAHAMLGVS